MAFVKAKREQVYLKLLLSGPSGSGKSYSALRLATGIYKHCGGPGIAYIGTEGSRNKYYANEFDYDLLEITEPFTIDKYLAAIKEAVAAGYKVLIIDSLSHEWKWLNDTHDKMPGNSFQNWGKLKPLHHSFMDTVLTAPIHVIATARGKDEWIIEDDDRGKKTPKKVGVGAQQDKDISYEYTVSLQIQQDTHIAATDKDNTHIFDGRYAVLTEEDGEKLYAWANSGETPTKPNVVEVPAAPATSEDRVATMQKEVIALCKELGGTKNEALMAVLKTFSPKADPRTVKEESKCIEMLNAVRALKEGN